ncbi:protein-L-isoaspartate(D-aspartate) O-methyltransferase [Litorimonas sp. RW-G-Af-16]|uniref:protein-L-isoaspartate(D-aspartate) O-methyltransferase n=1 Tax=Litorimonas sp. RW-G-Af-16 TaxID=3241168 RepID=UPI00390C832F
MALRGRGISDNAVLRAMELVDRKHFVRKEDWPVAYEAQSLPLACGQSLSEPLTIALMCQIAGLSRDHKLLEIGVGSGYQTAILSKIVTRVYAVERYKTLISDAEDRFKTLAIQNIVIRHGDGRYGWKGQAPFDRIILGCACLAPPQMLLDQLASGGRLVAVIDGQLMTFDKARTNITEREIMPLSLDTIEAGKSHTI